MAETRPMTFKTDVVTDPKLQAKVRAKIAKTRLPKDVKALLESKDYQAVLAVRGLCRKSGLSGLRHGRCVWWRFAHAF